MRKHNRGTMCLGWLCCLIVATATVAQADTFFSPDARKGPTVSSGQDAPMPDGWGDWIEIGCKFGVVPRRYCPEPIKVVVPPWCQDSRHHHTTLVLSGHKVGVVVDDGVPFKH